MRPTSTQAPALDYGALRIFRQDGEEIVHDETARREVSTGKATVYDAHGSNGLLLTLHDSRWLNGDRDVRVVRRNSSPERFDVLVSRLRMGVQTADDGDCLVWLRVADPADPRPTRKQVSLAALQAMTDVDPVEHLMAVGATAIGTGSELGLPGKPTRNQLAVRFPQTAEIVPLAAFTLTTILPLARASPS